jgi:hypothetical protein
MCAGHQIWSGEEIEHEKFVTYPLNSPTQTSHCYMCICQCMCYILPALSHIYSYIVHIVVLQSL